MGNKISLYGGAWSDKNTWYKTLECADQISGKFKHTVPAKIVYTKYFIVPKGCIIKGVMVNVHSSNGEGMGVGLYNRSGERLAITYDEISKGNKLGWTFLEFVSNYKGTGNACRLGLSCIHGEHVLYAKGKTKPDWNRMLVIVDHGRPASGDNIYVECLDKHLQVDVADNKRFGNLEICNGTVNFSFDGVRLNVANIFVWRRGTLDLNTINKVVLTVGRNNLKSGIAVYGTLKLPSTHCIRWLETLDKRRVKYKLVIEKEMRDIE